MKEESSHTVGNVCRGHPLHGRHTSFVYRDTPETGYLRGREKLPPHSVSEFFLQSRQGVKIDGGHTHERWLNGLRRIFKLSRERGYRSKGFVNTGVDGDVPLGRIPFLGLCTRKTEVLVQVRRCKTEVSYQDQKGSSGPFRISWKTRELKTGWTSKRPTCHGKFTHPFSFLVCTSGRHEIPEIE